MTRGDRVRWIDDETHEEDGAGELLEFSASPDLWLVRFRSGQRVWVPQAALRPIDDDDLEKAVHELATLTLRIAWLSRTTSRRIARLEWTVAAWMIITVIVTWVLI